MFDIRSKTQDRSLAAAHRAPSRERPAFGLTTLGSNQALQRHMRAHGLRAKLAVGSVHDTEETEADQTANSIMSGEIGPCACGGTCESCRNAGEKVRRKPAAGPAAQNPSARTEAFGSSAGRPLDAGARSFFERHFGDLSGVRVHDGEEAASTAAAISARAYTIGSDIGFAAGAYAPGSGEGRKLLAHELAHVAQAGAIVRRQPDDKNAPSPIVGAPKPISLMLDPSQMCGPGGCFTDADIDALAEAPTDPWGEAAPRAASAKQSVEEGAETEDQPSGRAVTIGPFVAVGVPKKGPAPPPAPPSTPTPTPTNVSRIIQGSENPLVESGTAAMAAKTGQQPTTFGEGNLAGVDEVSIIAHGSFDRARIGTVAYSARDLAQALYDSGWRGGTVRLIVCKTGLCGTRPTAYGQELANVLAELRADSAVIAPKGNTSIETDVVGLPQVRPPTETSPSPPGEEWEIYVAEAPKEPSFFSPQAWKGTAVGALKTVALIGLSILHSKAVIERTQQQAQKTGFAPIGPTGDTLYDLGAWFLDPTNETQRSVPFSQRFHMATWRQTIRDAADKKAVGDTYKFPWETDDGWDALREHRKTKTCYVYYRKGPSGYWYTIKGSCDEDDFFPPDLNKVIDPNVSDEELRKYLELPSPSADIGDLA